MESNYVQLAGATFMTFQLAFAISPRVCERCNCFRFCFCFSVAYFVNWNLRRSRGNSLCCAMHTHTHTATYAIFFSVHSIHHQPPITAWMVSGTTSKGVVLSLTSDSPPRARPMTMMMEKFATLRVLKRKSLCTNTTARPALGFHHHLTITIKFRSYEQNTFFLLSRSGNKINRNETKNFKNEKLKIVEWKICLWGRRRSFAVSLDTWHHDSSRRSFATLCDAGVYFFLSGTWNRILSSGS